MYVLDIASAIKKIPVNEIRDFIFEDYYKELIFLRKTVIIQWNIRKKIFKMFAIKLKEKNTQSSQC